MRIRLWSVLVCLLVLFLLFNQPIEAKKKKKEKAPKAKSEGTKPKSEIPKPATKVPVPEPAPSKLDQVLEAVDAEDDKEKEETKPTADKSGKKPTGEKEEKEKKPAAGKVKDKTKEQRLKELKEKKARKARLVEKKKKALETRLAQAKTKNEKKAEKRRKLAEKKEKADAKVHEALDKAARKKIEDDTPENRQRGEAKLKWLQQQADASSNHIVSLDTEAYKEYLNSGPRPYWLFVEYTAMHPSARCSICHLMRDVVSPVAQAYWANREAIKKKFLEKDDTFYPIFFVEVDVARNRELFGQLELTTAPLVSLIPPKSDSSAEKIKNLLPKLKKFRFTAISPTMTAEDIRDFTFKLTGLDTELEAPIQWSQITLIFTGIVVVILCSYYFGDVIRQSRYSMFGATLLFYLFCISGGMYNFIRNTPFDQVNGDHVEYIARGSRSQYGAESWIVSFIVLVSSISGIHLNRVAFKETGGEKSDSDRFLEKYCVPLLTPSISFALLGFCWYCLVKIYDMKTWGYKMGWVI